MSRLKSEVVQQFVDDPHFTQSVVDTVTANGQALLLAAACKGQLEVVRYLAEQRHIAVDVGTAGDGYTPLLVAAWTGHVDVVRYLVDTCHAQVHARTRAPSRCTCLAT